MSNKIHNIALFFDLDFNPRVTGDWCRVRTTFNNEVYNRFVSNYERTHGERIFKHEIRNHGVGHGHITIETDITKLPKVTDYDFIKMIVNFICFTRCKVSELKIDSSVRGGYIWYIDNEYQSLGFFYDDVDPESRKRYEW